MAILLFDYIIRYKMYHCWKVSIMWCKLNIQDDRLYYIRYIRTCWESKVFFWRVLFYYWLLENTTGQPPKTATLKHITRFYTDKFGQIRTKITKKSGKYDIFFRGGFFCLGGGFLVQLSNELRTPPLNQKTPP